MKRISLRRALDDPQLLGSILSGDSWAAWRAVLIASQGEPLTDVEREHFRRLTGREREPLERCEELVAIVGRRGGKTRAAAVLAVFMAALCDHHSKLVAGERGLVPFLAANMKQATVAFGHCRGIFDSVPLLRKLVVNRTADTISLSNGIDLEIRAASFRGLRGATAVCIIADEAAFWWTDGAAANADVEVLNAVRPSLATTGGPLITISSPYAKRGVVFEAYKDNFGPKGDAKILVAKGSSKAFNPSLPQKVIDRAYAKDAAWASAEYGGEFRSDVEAFIARELVEALVDKGVTVRAPVPGISYAAFADAAGGGGGDSFTCGIAHREPDGTVVLDFCGEQRPPFNASATVKMFCDVLAEYRISAVTGDRYAGAVFAQEFGGHGVQYYFSIRDRSQIYVDVLPLLTSGKVKLLDHKKLVNQISSLERRPGPTRDRIDHPAHGGHDDVSNSACGALVLASVSKLKTNTPGFLVKASDLYSPNAPFPGAMSGASGAASGGYDGGWRRFDNRGGM